MLCCILFYYFTSLRMCCAYQKSAEQNDKHTHTEVSSYNQEECSHQCEAQNVNSPRRRRQWNSCDLRVIRCWVQGYVTIIICAWVCERGWAPSFPHFSQSHQCVKMGTKWEDWRGHKLSCNTEFPTQIGLWLIWGWFKVFEYTLSSEGSFFMVDDDEILLKSRKEI